MSTHDGSALAQYFYRFDVPDWLARDLVEQYNVEAAEPSEPAPDVSAKQSDVRAAQPAEERAGPRNQPDRAHLILAAYLEAIHPRSITDAGQELLLRRIRQERGERDG